MIREAAPSLNSARILENGCGVGLYLRQLLSFTPAVFGLDYDFERATAAGRCFSAGASLVVCGQGERLPYADGCFDLIVSNEVIEHVADDQAAMAEMARVLRPPDPWSGRPGGRIILFCPNRWYPVETHGIFWRGQYRFGNIPLVNYLPHALRNKLAPHVRAYTVHEVRRLFDGLPLRLVKHTRIFGGYDNLIARFGWLGKFVRGLLYRVERTPLSVLGLSHFLVLERV